MSFQRDAAVREWRTSILSRGGLTVGEVDELEDHLELVEAELKASVRPEEAFWLAAHRVGTPDALTREFAKVRPNMGWAVRAQWVLLGLLAYVLLVPAVQALWYLLAAGLAGLPGLVGVSEGLRLYAVPLSIAVVFSGVVWLVRRSGASPVVVDRAVGRLADWGRHGLVLAVLVTFAWQLGLEALLAHAFSLGRAAMPGPGEPAALQSDFWYLLASGFRFMLPALYLGLIFRVQRRLERARPAA